MSEDIQTDGGGVLMDVTNTYEVHGWLILSGFFVLFVGTGIGEPLKREQCLCSIRSQVIDNEKRRPGQWLVLVSFVLPLML